MIEHMKIIEQEDISLKKAILFFVAITVIISLLSCGMKEDIEINGIFHEFTVENNRVYFRCELIIYNNTDSLKLVELYADLPEDKDILIKQDRIIAVFQNNVINTTFVLQPGKNTFEEVVFVGDFAGTEIKHDRNLPQIDIVPVELMIGKNTSITIPKDITANADYIKNNRFLINDSEFRKLVEYMRENNLRIKPGTYTYNQTVRYEALREILNFEPMED